MSPLPVTYTTEEVAAAFNVSRYFICDLVKAQKVTPLRTSKSKRAPMRFTDEHVEQVRKAMTPAVVPAPQRKQRRRRAA
jgi:transposase